MWTASMTIVGKRFGMAMAVLCLCASFGTAQAGSLWYNGDFDGNTGTFNGLGSSGGSGYVFDNFIVPAGQTWSLTDVYSNNLMSTASPVTSAYFEIRENVSTGSGGTLLYSGTESATQTYIGPGLFGISEYNVDISGLTGITLSGGPAGTTYWLTVAPIIGSNDTSYIATTSGANAIGMPAGNDGNSYLVGSLYGYDFEPAGDYATPLNITPENGGQPDFSMGVNGVMEGAVPEPSTLVMSAIGGLTLLGYAWRRRHRRLEA